MAYHVKVVVEAYDDQGEVYQHLETAAILPDSWHDADHEWASVMDAAVVGTFGYRPGFKIVSELLEDPEQA